MYCPPLKATILLVYFTITLKIQHRIYSINQLNLKKHKKKLLSNIKLETQKNGTLRDIKKTIKNITKI